MGTESSCARKEALDIDILITSRNGNRKIMPSIRITTYQSNGRLSVKTNQKKKTDLKILRFKQIN